MSNSASYYGLIVQSTAIVISAAGVIATIFWNIRVTRRRTTLEMLQAEQTTPLLLEYRSKFLSAVEAGKLEALAERDVFYFSPDSFFLVSTLNKNDLVAVGISEGIIDAPTYKRYWRSGFVRDWIRCKGAVIKRRQIRKDPTLFADFERLACRWAQGRSAPFCRDVVDDL